MASSLSNLPIDIPLTPEDRRRTEFAGGTPIALPGGHSWRFYEPTPVVSDVRGEGGVEAHMIVWEFGPNIDAETNDSLGRGYQKILGKIHRATNDRDRASGYLEAAWFLLARNYVVGQAEFEDMLISASRVRASMLFQSLRKLTDDVCAKCEALIRSLAREAN